MNGIAPTVDSFFDGGLPVTISAYDGSVAGDQSSPYGLRLVNQRLEDLRRADSVYGRNVVCLLKCIDANLPVGAQGCTVMTEGCHRGERIGIEHIREGAEVFA